MCRISLCECIVPDDGTYYSAEIWHTVFDKLWDTQEHGGDHRKNLSVAAGVRYSAFSYKGSQYDVVFRGT